MKLWILRPVEDVPYKNPWEPWFDKMVGAVVLAETEQQARQLAHEAAGDENSELENVNPWLDADYSSCVELTADGAAGVVIMDFYSA